MKKQLILISALLLVLCLAVSCGSTGAAVTPAQTGTPVAKTEPAAEGSTVEAAAAYVESAPATENAEPESGPADNAPAPSSTTPAPASAAASSQPAKSTAAKAPKQTATASSGAAQPASQPAQQAAETQAPSSQSNTTATVCYNQPAIVFTDLQAMNLWVLGRSTQKPGVYVDETIDYPAQVTEAWTRDGKVQYYCPALALAENVENVKLSRIDLNLLHNDLLYTFSYKTENVSISFTIDGYYSEGVDSPVKVDPEYTNATAAVWKDENETRLVEGFHQVEYTRTDKNGKTYDVYEGEGWLKQAVYLDVLKDYRRRPFMFRYKGRADAEGMDAMLKTIIPYLEMQIVTLDPAAE